MAAVGNGSTRRGHGMNPVGGSRRALRKVARRQSRIMPANDLLEHGAGPKQPRLDRPLGKLENAGDLLEWHSLEVRQDQRRAVVIGNPLQGRLQQSRTLPVTRLLVSRWPSIGQGGGDLLRAAV